MFKKLNNLKLILILAVLVGIYFIAQYTGRKKKSKSLRTELVLIDTAKVSKINIGYDSLDIDLFKEGEDWKLKLKEKTVIADNASVLSTLNALMTIKPSRMVSRKKSKWNEYQVDSTGTRIRTFEGSDKTLDIVLGRLGVQDRNSYHTFVRLFEDDNVYVAENFMSLSVSSDPSSYRNQNLAIIQKDSILAISFIYPADSSVQLSNDRGVWSINGQLADSTAIATYLSDVNYIRSKEFYDENNTFINPILTVRYKFSNQDDISIEAYQSEGQWIFHSLENKDNYFKDTELLGKIFKGQSAFLK